jgi:hypothetical protein
MGWAAARVSVEREAEVLDRPHSHEPFPAPLPLEHNLRPATMSVAANRAFWDLSSFDARARHPNRSAK